MIRLSKSSPPRNVSPLVASTSNWCSPSTSAISMIEMSNVPPPKSYTAILLSPRFLSRPYAKRCRGRLVDDALDLEARDLARVLGRLALRVVEIRGHGDHGLGDFLAEVVFGRLLHLGEHARGDFRRRHLLAGRLDPGVAVLGLHDLVRDHADVLLDDVVLVAAADQALHREQRVRRIRDRLALGRLTDEHLAVLREGDDRRSRTIAFAVLDHLRLAAVHDRDAGVGRPQVDADHSTHRSMLQKIVAENRLNQPRSSL